MCAFWVRGWPSCEGGQPHIHGSMCASWVQSCFTLHGWVTPHMWISKPQVIATIYCQSVIWVEPKLQQKYELGHSVLSPIRSAVGPQDKHPLSQGSATPNYSVPAYCLWYHFTLNNLLCFRVTGGLSSQIPTFNMPFWENEMMYLMAPSYCQDKIPSCRISVFKAISQVFRTMASTVASGQTRSWPPRIQVSSNSGLQDGTVVSENSSPLPNLSFFTT